MKRSALVGVKVAVSLGPPGLPLLEHRPRARSRSACARRTSSTCWPRSSATSAMLALATWRWRLLLETLGRPRADAQADRLVPGRDLLQQLPPEQHRRRHRARARRLAADRLDDRLARRRRHRPHPGLRRPLRARGGRLRARRRPPCAGWPGRGSCSSASRSSSWLLAYVFFRPGHRARLLAALAARPRSPWAREQFETAQGAVHALPRARRDRLAGGARASLAIQALVVCYYLRDRARARASRCRRRGVPDGPAVHAAAGGADLLQRLGPARGALHPVLRPGRPAARERARLLARRRRAHGAALALGRRRLDGPRQRVPAPSPRPPEAGWPSPSSTSATSSASAGRASTASRACSPGGSRATTAARFDVSLVRAQAPRARDATGSREQGIPVHHLGRGRFDPRHPARPRRSRPRARRARPARPRLRRRRLRPPRRARSPARSWSSTSTSPTRACPATRRWPTACSRRCTDGGDRGERLDARVPGARALRARRSACASSGTARRSTSSPRCRASGRWRVRREPRASRRRRRRRHDRPPERPEGPRASCVDAAATCSRRTRRARLLIVGRRRPAGRRCASRRARARHRRPDRLRRPPHRRARPARRARRVLHLVALRGHAARALRGDGGRQGDRLDRRRRLPRGADGRRDGPAGAARRRRGARGGPRARRWRDAALREELGPRAREASRQLRRRAPASTRCRRFYDDVLAGGRR